MTLRRASSQYSELAAIASRAGVISRNEPRTSTRSSSSARCSDPRDGLGRVGNDLGREPASLHRGGEHPTVEGSALVAERRAHHEVGPGVGEDVRRGVGVPAGQHADHHGPRSDDREPLVERLGGSSNGVGVVGDVEDDQRRVGDHLEPGLQAERGEPLLHQVVVQLPTEERLDGRDRTPRRSRPGGRRGAG